MAKNAIISQKVAITPPVAGGFKPYPEYKSTGLAWLSQVPAGWGIRKMKYLFSERSEKGFPNEPLLAATQNHGVILKADYENRTVTAEKGLESLKLVRVGDFVISLRSFEGGIELAYQQGIISPAYTILVSEGVLTNGYFKYLGKSDTFLQLLKTCVTGIREGQNINYEKLRINHLPIPSPDEQRRIVAYLDEKTAKIDRLIQLKEREIELLNEKKQAMISKVVSGRFAVESSNAEAQRRRDGSAPSPVGRDVLGAPQGNESRGARRSPPTTPVGRGLRPRRSDELVDSGVDWIGQVPKGWKVCRLTYRYGVQLGKMLDSQRITGDYLVPYLRNQDVQWDSVNLVDLPMMDIMPDERDRFRVMPGDLLVCEGGEIGRTAVFCGNMEVYFQKAIMRLRARCGQDDSIRFMWYVMRAASVNNAFCAATGKSTIAHLPAEKLSASRFAFPPLPEQREIVAYLDGATAKIDAAVAAIEKGIGLLKERRTRLVSDAVTGRIDLRSVNGASDSELNNL